MSHFDIVKTSEIEDTFRVAMVKNSFDVRNEHTQEHLVGDIPIEDRKWNIGLIVGSSGTGKTTIAKELFGECGKSEYTHKSVIDDMPSDCSFDEISKMFYSVGFSSVPSWMKPYNVLSNGEKMRVDLAYLLLKNMDITVFDEFTSVVDRRVAETSSIAVNKVIRRLDRKFIAVSCHYDIIDWLNPDWIFNTNTMTFQWCDTSVVKKKNILSDNALQENGIVLGNITICVPN